MKNLYLILIFLLVVVNVVSSQDCDCDFIITPKDYKDPNLNIVWGKDLNILPGSTICIKSGTYKALRFYDIVGTKEQPITVKNCGGKVNILAPSYSGISFQRSSNFRLTGAGVPGLERGIVLVMTNRFSSAIYMENYTTDFEIDHIEIDKTGFAGIMAKTDPYCDKPGTWRRNGFVMKNIKIHDNKINNIGGEGIYLGYTGGYKVTTRKSCAGTPIFGHWLENVEIYDNVINKTGLDGIQVNLVRKNCKIYNNQITNYATKGIGFQNFGMSLGGGEYEVFNNFIINGANGSGGDGNGIQLISAQSGTEIYNNIIDRVKFHGIFIHQRHKFENPDIGYKIFNNTIINPELSGIHYNSQITQSEDTSEIGLQQDDVPVYMVNNLIVDPGNDFSKTNTWKKSGESFIDFNNRSTAENMKLYAFKNYFTRNLDALGLDNKDNAVYAIIDEKSPLVDAGMDITGWDLTFDILFNARLQGNNVDIGAYESVFSYIPDTGEKVSFDIIPNPVGNHFSLTSKQIEGKVDMVIYSVNAGYMIYQGSYEMGMHFVLPIMAPGYYIVEINIDGQTYSKQMVKS